MNSLEDKGLFRNEIEYWTFYIDWIRICCSINPESINREKSILRGIQVLYGEQR
ncbi:hypothetical protein [Faecalicatena contorta]|uniref:hypothetical protein n=1 Tax=Faecalicatena contorta TaxID=39482 RepID=UPI00321654A0